MALDLLSQLALSGTPAPNGGIILPPIARPAMPTIPRFAPIQGAVGVGSLLGADAEGRDDLTTPGTGVIGQGVKVPLPRMNPRRLPASGGLIDTLTGGTGGAAPPVVGPATPPHTGNLDQLRDILSAAAYGATQAPAGAGPIGSAAAGFFGARAFKQAQADKKTAEAEKKAADATAAEDKKWERDYKMQELALRQEEIKAKGGDGFTPTRRDWLAWKADGGTLDFLDYQKALKMSERDTNSPLYVNDKGKLNDRGNIEVERIVKEYKTRPPLGLTGAKLEAWKADEEKNLNDLREQITKRIEGGASAGDAAASAVAGTNAPIGSTAAAGTPAPAASAPAPGGAGKLGSAVGASRPIGGNVTGTGAPDAPYTGFRSMDEARATMKPGDIYIDEFGRPMRYRGPQ